MVSYHVLGPSKILELFRPLTQRLLRVKTSKEDKIAPFLCQEMRSVTNA